MHIQTRQMPMRFMIDAPAIVRKSVIDIFEISPAAPLDFDIVFRPQHGDQEVTGLDFDKYGARGCHFFLKPHEARGYRERNRRKRVAWAKLPEATRRAITAYLSED